jgi:archaellum component FlaC
MERNTEENLKLAESQLKLSLETTQEFVDMWTKNYQSTLGKLAHVPAFGPVREKQEKMMKSIPLYSKLYTTWVDSNINLQSVLLEATRRTFEKTVEHQVNSSKCTEDGKSCIDPEKYKEFYKIWIDTYSDTFKEFMKSGHYASDMGKFASIFIDFQSHNREMIEENYLKPNNLPTKTDIDEIHKESYNLRTTVKQLVKDLKTSSTDTNTEIDKLRNELQNAKQSTIDANANVDKLHKELQDLRVIVENLVKNAKTPVGTDEILSKKVDLSKSQKVDPSKKVEQTKKTELPDNKEVHT